MAGKKRQWINPEGLTTSQVGRMCGVCGNTVRKWCNSGLLKCWKLPGGRQRRIRYCDLEIFCREMKMMPPAKLPL